MQIFKNSDLGSIKGIVTKEQPSEQIKQILTRNEKIEEDKAKVAFFESVTESKEAIFISNAVKTLNKVLKEKNFLKYQKNQKYYYTIK